MIRSLCNPPLTSPQLHLHKSSPCRISILRNGHVPYSLSFLTSCRMSLGSVSPVEFKKCPCCQIDLRGISGPLTGGPDLRVDLKKAQCRPVEFKKYSCHLVEFKKCPCLMSLSFYISCRMSLRPKMAHVAQSILGV